MDERNAVLSDATLKERFQAKVDVRGDDDCWNWTAYKSAGRYGAIKVGGKKGKDLKAHRIQAIWHGLDINGKVVRHTCDNGLCVNPAHLRVGTQADNVQDMYERRRDNHAKGERSANSVLTDATAKAARRLLQKGLTTREVAARLNVSYQVIYRLASRKTYRHVGVNIEYLRPSSKGSRHHNAKISDQDVAEMRRAYRKILNYSAVAKQFGVSRHLATRAIRGERWPGVVMGEPPILDRPDKVRQYGQRSLTDQQAREIKQLLRKNPRLRKSLAEKYNVSVHLISAIKSGRAYAWVD